MSPQIIQCPHCQTRVGVTEEMRCPSCRVILDENTLTQCASSGPRQPQSPSAPNEPVKEPYGLLAKVAGITLIGIASTFVATQGLSQMGTIGMVLSGSLIGLGATLAFGKKPTEDVSLSETASQS